jgi:hypothetical protein
MVDKISAMDTNELKDAAQTFTKSLKDLNETVPGITGQSVIPIKPEKPKRHYTKKDTIQ